MQPSHQENITMEKQFVKNIEKQFSNASLLPEIIKLVDEGHSVTLQLKGFSMRPFLENNRDKAILVKPTNIKVGDAVLAEVKPGFYVLHRIVDIQGQEITLRGDGNLNTEHCLLQDVKASVMGFYRKGKKKIDKTDGLKWRTYSAIWTALLPCRRYLLAFYRRIWIPLFGTL